MTDPYTVFIWTSFHNEQVLCDQDQVQVLVLSPDLDTAIRTSIKPLQQQLQKYNSGKLLNYFVGGEF